MNTLALIASFLLVTLASQHIGKFATYLKMPLISGYLITGAVVGPFLLGWLSYDGTKDLRVVDNMALAYIAFAAGSELYLKEIRSRLKSIAWITSFLVASTFALGTLAVLFLAEHIPFMQKLSFGTQVAVALMAASIMVARSPSSAIAIVNEMRARGPFTKTVLGVTVVMDSVVITLFAICMSIAHPLVSGGGFEARFLLQVVVELALSAAGGWLTAKAVQIVTSADVKIRIKTVAVLLLGLGVYSGVEWVAHFSAHQIGFKIAPEPLLVCMVAGVLITNSARHRDMFAQILHDVGPVVYLAFFTLVGASLALDILILIWPMALVLFGVRLVGIITGSVVGGVLAKDPPRYNRLGWLSYVTQAGVGLGLAKDVASSFTEFGTEFATLIIAVIVVNQLVGPPMFKLALKRAGEARLPGVPHPDEVRDVLILGIDDQTLRLARQLEANGWQVILADIDETLVRRLATEKMESRHISVINQRSLATVVSDATDAVVCTLADDALNFKACELASVKFGIQRLVVRLHDLSWSDKFNAIGAMVVEPASAMVNLLDQFVRAPAMAQMVLHRDPEHEIVQITLTDPDLDGLPLRELRLPIDVRVLGIVRDGHAIVPSGHTVLKLTDEVTLVGEKETLDEIAVKWGF